MRHILPLVLGSARHEEARHVMKGAAPEEFIVI